MGPIELLFLVLIGLFGAHWRGAWLSARAGRHYHAACLRLFVIEFFTRYYVLGDRITTVLSKAWRIADPDQTLLWI